MSNTILENLRSKHEEVEQLEKALAKALTYKENNPKERVTAEIIIKKCIEQIQKRSRELISLYEDKELKERMNFIDLSLIEQPKGETLTLKDYKLFSNMLKTILENNGSNNLKVSEILDKALLTRYSLEEYSKFEKILNSCLN